MRLTLGVIALYLLIMSPFIVVVTSESMEPTLKVGDLVFLTHDEPSIGDVIVYKHGNIYIIHRLIGEKDGKYVTKGDNPATNPSPDPRDVYPEDVVGVAKVRVPYLGYLVIIIRKYPVIFIPLIILVAFYDRIVPEVNVRINKRRAYLILILLMITLRLHPRTPEKAYLKDRNSYFTGDGYYVSVTFYASGNTDVYIKILTPSQEYVFVRHYVYPGTSGIRNTGFFVQDKPIEVIVWTRVSRNGGRSTKRRASR